MALDSAFFDSPLLLVAKIAPWSASSTILAALVMDGQRLHAILESGWDGGIGGDSGNASSSPGDEASGGGSSGALMLGEALGFVFVGGLASFGLLMAEMKLLQLTSSLTLGVMGTFKVDAPPPPPPPAPR